jgi:hypothetical protein
MRASASENFQNWRLDRFSVPAKIKKFAGWPVSIFFEDQTVSCKGTRSQPGQGSTFAFTLPVVVARQVEPVA